jgi:predicted small lipoprotein YifL
MSAMKWHTSILRTLLRVCLTTSAGLILWSGLSGCGQKGNLYLPTPAAASAPASSASR